MEIPYLPITRMKIAEINDINPLQTPTPTFPGPDPNCEVPFCLLPSIAILAISTPITAVLQIIIAIERSIDLKLGHVLYQLTSNGAT
jgi:hypothetical protein